MLKAEVLPRAIPTPSTIYLLPLKLRRTLLQEGAGALVLVLGRAANSKQCRLQEQSIRQSEIAAVIHGFDGILHSEWRVGNDLRRDRLGARNEFGCRHNFI